jgi:hypothetical protein
MFYIMMNNIGNAAAQKQMELVTKFAATHSEQVFLINYINFRKMKLKLNFLVLR